MRYKQLFAQYCVASLSTIRNPVRHLVTSKDEANPAIVIPSDSIIFTSYLKTWPFDVCKYWRESNGEKYTNIVELKFAILIDIK